MSRSWSCVVVFLVWSSVAHAQSAGAQAEVLFRQARDLMADGKIAEACDAFAESEKLDPAVTTLLNLAGCDEKLGKLATAWGEFLDAERETRAATDKATKQLHAIAKKKSDMLEPLVSKLTVNVPAASDVDGLEIDRDGDPLGPVMWNRAMPIDGGTYSITARAPGANPWSTEVTIDGQGDEKTVDIPDLRNLPRDLEPVEVHRAKAKPLPPPEVIVEPTATRPHHSKLVPMLLGGGALVLGGGALGLELWGESDYDAATSATEPDQRDALQGSANAKRLGAQGLAVAGVACAGVAIWLFLHRPHAESLPDAEDEEASLHFVASPAGLAVIGAF